MFGHPQLNVIPQTSTIASHLPRSVGLAFALSRAAKLGVTLPWPRDAIVVCSFGDASANHSTAAGALNAAAYCTYQGLPLPLLLVCEDNGIGISVRTAPGWIEAAQKGRPQVKYFHADGADLAGVYDTALEAAAWARDRRRPAFLHLSVVRFGGHAGSDVESGYRGPAEIAADLDRDPLVGTARLLVASGALTPSEVLARYEASVERIMALAAEVTSAPRLSSAGQVMAPLAPRRPALAAANARYAPPSVRGQAFASRRPEDGDPLTLAQTINATLADALACRPEMLVFGEDVGRKGGVYGVTRGLARQFGAARVFDTLLDEQSILGLALGAGVAGLLPVPEIQYLAYLHNAADQIRGEAATLSFFSRGQYRNPMVLRIAGLAYQKGFGGHFHNDNAVAALRDIPGLIIAVPARPEDAAPMLRSCLAAAETDGSVCVILEPIALYHERDLHEPGDGEWLAPYEPPWRWATGHIPLGCPGCTGGREPDDRDVRQRAADEPAGGGPAAGRGHPGAGDGPALAGAAAGGRHPAGSDDDRPGAGGGRDAAFWRGVEAVVTALADAGFTGPVARVTSRDSFIPLGDAAATVLCPSRPSRPPRGPC